MMHTVPGDSIAALATPRGRGALAVVRISGREALCIADAVFQGRKRLSELAGFQGAFGRIHDGDVVVDEVIAWVYRAPHTYTGEDLVEFSCHGGPGLCERILEALWRHGARPADPGEFTRRAFMSGRVDLTQAEAVADLISARGARAQAQALYQLQGGLSHRVSRVAEALRDVLARITVYLDFEEDVPEVPDARALHEKIVAAGDGLRVLRDQHAPSHRLRQGLRVALVGRPNVGKSSLLNSLIGTDRALVHVEPGTTRDVVDADVEWNGLSIHLFDTAGLREGRHAVERAGIDRSRSLAREADVVLWVVDCSREATALDHEIGRSFEALESTGALYVIGNKADLGVHGIEWVNVYSPIQTCLVSALLGTGLEAVREMVTGVGLRHVPEAESLAGVNERHSHLLDQAVEALDRGALALKQGIPAECAAADLSRCLDALAEITGEKAGPELLDTIFSQFCIGK